jgi:hypothetical protein
LIFRSNFNAFFGQDDRSNKRWYGVDPNNSRLAPREAEVGESDQVFGETASPRGRNRLDQSPDNEWQAAVAGIPFSQTIVWELRNYPAFGRAMYGFDQLTLANFVFHHTLCRLAPAPFPLRFHHN